MDAVNEELNQATARLAGKTIVAKLGGSALGNHDTTLQDAVALAKAGIRVVLVHGGGAAISGWLERTGKEPRFVDGLRVTDEATLEIVVMVLAGKVNKELVGQLLALGAPAVGISGLDGGTLRARKRSAELGMVGDVIGVDTRPIEALLSGGFLPVIAPIGLGEDGQALNINADTAASELALALRAERVVFLSDVPGICDANGQVLRRLTVSQARGLIATGVITRGMIPKAEACFRALAGVPAAQIVDGRSQHALLRELSTEGSAGTTILP